MMSTTFIKKFNLEIGMRSFKILMHFYAYISFFITLASGLNYISC